MIIQLSKKSNLTSLFKNEQAQAFVWFWIGSDSDYDKLLDSFLDRRSSSIAEKYKKL